MTLTSTAFSFLLLFSGLAACGWHFFTALRRDEDAPAPNAIGKLLASLFFLFAGYNGILGIGSLFLSKSPNGLFIIALVAHLALTALAIVSVYTVYYIFAPETSPKQLLMVLGLMGMVGTIFYLAQHPLPFQNPGDGINWNLSPQLALITFCLLAASLISTAFIFLQLFRKTTERALKTISLSFAILAGLAVVPAFDQLLTAFHRAALFPPSTNNWILAAIGAGFLISCITTPALRGATAIFVGLVGWWVVIHLQPDVSVADNLKNPREIWAFAYQAIALWGIWWGFKLARENGGFKNPLGKVIYLFTIGLLTQIIGHNSYFFYVFVLNSAVPYPGIPDFGYIGTNIIYVLAAIQLGKALLVNYNLSAIRGRQWLAVVLPIITGLAYYFFILRTYIFDWNQPITIVVDWLAYPLVGALYLTVALFVYLKADSMKYRWLKPATFLILTALGIQYFADAAFTYMTASGSYWDGSLSDCIYFFGYFLMAIALIKLGGQNKATSLNAATEEKLEQVTLPLAPSAASSPKSNYGLIGAITFFTIFLAWWTMLYLKSNGNPQVLSLSIWPYAYNLMALFGVWLGFKAVQRCGGFKNLLGKALSFFTLGLLCQVFGQIIFSAYTNFLLIETPYPSLADIPYLASPIFYLIALLVLGRAVGINYHIKKLRGKYWALILLTLLLMLSYFALGSDYQLNIEQPLIPVLDALYPLAEAITLTMAMLIFFFLKLKNKKSVFSKAIPLISIAVGVQYIADTLFTYQAAHDGWINGSYGELPYLMAYFLMTIALVRLGNKRTATQITGSILINTNTSALNSSSGLTSRIKESNVYFKALAGFIAIRSGAQNRKKSNSLHTCYDISKL